MDWEECKIKGFVKEARKDEPLINSLLKSSDKRLQSEEMLELNETTASSKVSLAYDSLRELMEAVALMRGFKVYNHECFCAFLRTIVRDDISAEDFDRLRRIRNAINYYGKDIKLNEAEGLIRNIYDLKEKIKKKFLG